MHTLATCLLASAKLFLRNLNHEKYTYCYDAPIDMRKYVHRVGRTARAGREGNAWTLIEEQEARYFKRMLQEADHLSKVKRLRVSEKEITTLTPHYEVQITFLNRLWPRHLTTMQ